MDEASSRFVDQLAINKLINEKLEKVHHYPTVPSSMPEDDIFDDFESISTAPEIISVYPTNTFTVKSPVISQYMENQHVPIVSFDAEDSIATIIFMHGLFEENRDIYSFLFKCLNKSGYSIKLMTLPYHYERKPASSLFSGEYFWSADIIRTRNAFKQAVYELYQVYAWSKENTQKKVFISGFSMGASVSLLMTALYPEIDGLFIINPAASLSDIIWDSPLCKTIKRDFLIERYSSVDLKKIYSFFDSAQITSSNVNPDKIRMVYALFDLVNQQEQYFNLIETWGLKNSIPYKAGHLNTLRVPRLADDIAQFFNSLM